MFATPDQAARKVPSPNRGTLTRHIGRTRVRRTEHVDDHLQRQSRDRVHPLVSGRGEATRPVFQAPSGASSFTAVAGGTRARQASSPHRGSARIRSSQSRALERFREQSNRKWTHPETREPLRSVSMANSRATSKDCGKRSPDGAQRNPGTVLPFDRSRIALRSIRATIGRYSRTTQV
jgi:hypothetical protein